MTEYMDKRFKDCLKNKKIFSDPDACNLANKELKVALDDLEEAKDRYKNRKYKYATGTAYYAIFHAVRALICSVGYRERSHYCLALALEEFFVKQKKLLTMKDVRSFFNAMALREDADYAFEYSKDGAKIAIESAEEFIKKAKKILSNK